MANERIHITLSASDQATPQVSKLNREFGKLETSTKNLSGQSAGGLGGFDNLATSINAAVAGLGVAGFASIVSDLNQLGTEAQGVSTLFETLAGGAGEADKLLNQLRQTTGNVVSDFDLMAGSQQLMRMGLADTSSEVSDLIEMAVKLKKPTESASEAIANFTLMLANQSVARLDSFGISSGRVRDGINELLESGQALNREEAFTMAVMEQGSLAIERLGDAALISETSLNRLQVRLENAKMALAEFTATGIETGAQMLEIGAMGFDAAAEGTLNDFITAAAIATISELDPNLGRELATRHTDIMNQRNMSPTIASPSSVTGRIVPQGELEARASIRNAILSIDDLIGGGLTGMGNVLSSTARQSALSPDSMFGRFNARYVDLQNQTRDGRGNMGLMTPEAINAAIAGYDQLKSISDSIQQNPFITDNEKALVEGMADGFGRIKDDAVAAQKAFENMSLDQMLGRESGGRLGELSDMVLANLTDESRAGVQTDFDLATGRESTLGLAVENELAPQVAEITEKLGSEAGIRAMEAMLNAIENGQVSGMSQEDIATRAGLDIFATTPFGQRLTGMAEGAGEFFGGFSMGGEEGNDAFGNPLYNEDTTMQASQIAESTAMIAELSNSASFGMLVESGAEVVAIMDEANAIITDATQNKRMSVTVDIMAGNVDPLAGAALRDEVEKMKRDNGGRIPDAS